MRSTPTCRIRSLSPRVPTCLPPARRSKACRETTLFEKLLHSRFIIGLGSRPRLLEHLPTAFDLLPPLVSQPRDARQEKTPENQNHPFSGVERQVRLCSRVGLCDALATIAPSW